MIGTLLLAFSEISDKAAAELKRAGCPVHEEVVDAYINGHGVRIAELHYYHDADRHWEHDLQTLSVWGNIREVQIRSLGLYLARVWIEDIQGWRLIEYGEEVEAAPAEAGPDDFLNDEDLSSLDDHPF
jgi:hypothetical protein